MLQTLGVTQVSVLILSYSAAKLAAAHVAQCGGADFLGMIQPLFAGMLDLPSTRSFFRSCCYSIATSCT